MTRWFLTLGLLACTAFAEKPVVTVAAAANLKPALEALVSRYTKSHQVDVRVTFGASTSLATQLQQGAPFELFFSADADAPRRLADAGLTSSPVRPYAVGTLVLWAPKDSALPLDKGLAVLLDPRVKSIAIANPALAPYGLAAQQALTAAKLWDQVKPRLVQGASISQAAQFVQSGNAQVGLLAKSLTVTPPLDDGHSVPVDASLHAPIVQAAVVMKGATPEAKAFFDFVLGPDGRAVLSSFGYGAPE